MTPAEWLALASQLDAQARELADQGRVGEAAVLSARAESYKETAARLTGGNRKRTVPVSMAVAEATGDWRKPPTLRELAKMLGCTHGFLSQARSGTTRIRKAWAERIAAARPDMPATKKTWPKGWADDPSEG